MTRLFKRLVHRFFEWLEGRRHALQVIFDNFFRVLGHTYLTIPLMYTTIKLVIMKEKQPRSERRFEKDLAKAVGLHADKLANKKLSLPSGLGKLVIIVSNAPDNRDNISLADQKKAFNDEADRLAEEHRNSHQEVQVKRIANAQDLRMDLTDREVTDLTLIGHGSIGDFWMDDGGHFGWQDVSESAKYLKQGKIFQRVCGHYALKTSVATGTFGVSDQRNVLAPVGLKIPDVNPDESLFVPVYQQASNTVADILKLTNEGYEASD